MLDKMKKALIQFLDRYPWFPGVLTIAYFIFGLVVVALAIYVPSIGDHMRRFFSFVSYILILGPIIISILQILNFKNTISTIPRLAFLYFEIILMFGIIYFYAVSARDKNVQPYSSTPAVISGIDSVWVDHVREKNIHDKNTVMKEAILCLNDCVHFSLITSTTVGYGNMVPVAPMAKILVNIQVLVSFFLVAFGVGFVFAGKGKEEDLKIKSLEKRIESIELKRKK